MTTFATHRGASRDIQRSINAGSLWFIDEPDFHAGWSLTQSISNHDDLQWAHDFVIAHNPRDETPLCRGVLLGAAERWEELSSR